MTFLGERVGLTFLGARGGITFPRRRGMESPSYGDGGEAPSKEREGRNHFHRNALGKPLEDLFFFGVLRRHLTKPFRVVFRSPSGSLFEILQKPFRRF